MSDTQIESEKALGLARKYDEQGDLANAIKWCKKSIAISETPSARALLTRLETKGVNGGASTSSGVKSNGDSSGGTEAKSREGKEKKERTYTAEQVAVVKRIRSAGGDFYKVLSVEKTVDDNGIKKAYRKVGVCVGRQAGRHALNADFSRAYSSHYNSIPTRMALRGPMRRSSVSRCGAEIRPNATY